MDGRRGTMVAAKVRNYDDIAVGEELPEVEQLVTIPIMQRWSSDVEELRRDHYDSKYAIEHDGLPEAVLSGSFSQAYLWEILFNWVGPEAWVVETYQKNAAGVHPADVLTFLGRVTNKEVKNGLGYLELDIGLRLQDGTVPIPGTATVVLPLKGGRPVPYPFKP
jgi:hypothetical protein